ncbi:MAG: S41 family peptidase [Oscillospiraceae bacterium]
MNKKISLGTAIALMLIMIAATFSITMVYSAGIFSDKMHDIKEREAIYSKLSEIDNLVRTNYLNDIDKEKLMDSIADGYVKGLSDNYGYYMTAEKYQEKVQTNVGNVAGIGIVVTQDVSGYMLITEIIQGSPAQDAGIQVGDFIIKIEDLDVKTENFEECNNLIAGEPGTTLAITVRRDNNDDDMEITRRIIETPTVISNQIGDYGYIKILSFENTTPAQFNKALDSLLNKNVKGIVFDVRNNLGGTITSVSAILDRLLPEGPIVSATYKNGTTELLKSSDEIELNLPMVVLTNSKSASASELFAQALKDYNKAKSVGTITFGKGLMQTVYQLTDGSALEITVARYNPPKSPNFDGIGVKPDFEVSLPADLEQSPEMLTEDNDTQLKKAIAVLNGSVNLDNAAQSSSTESSNSSETSETSSDVEVNSEENSKTR